MHIFVKTRGTTYLRLLLVFRLNARCTSHSAQPPFVVRTSGATYLRLLEPFSLRFFAYFILLAQMHMHCNRRENWCVVKFNKNYVQNTFKIHKILVFIKVSGNMNDYLYD